MCNAKKKSFENAIDQYITDMSQQRKVTKMEQQTIISVYKNSNEVVKKVHVTTIFTEGTADDQHKKNVTEIEGLLCNQYGNDYGVAQNTDYLYTTKDTTHEYYTFKNKSIIRREKLTD